MQRFYESLTEVQKFQYLVMQDYRTKLNNLKLDLELIEMRGNGGLVHKLRGCICGVDRILSGELESIQGNLLEEFNEILKSEYDRYIAETREMRCYKR